MSRTGLGLATLSIVIAFALRVGATAPPTPVFLGSNTAASAINDHGEIAYLFNNEIYSTTRGLLVNAAANVDGSRIGLGNDGEVVYSDTTSAQQLHSTTRGIVSANRTSSPSLSMSTGEIVYKEIFDPPPFNRAIVSTLQGTIDSQPSAAFTLSTPAVNDLGEVVYSIRDLSTPFTRIFSSTRGFLTPDGEDAIAPAINVHGEVVWSAFDGGGRNQIFSSTRGQLTFFDGSYPFHSAIVPAINNRGDVTFRGDANAGGDHAPGIYLISVPEPAAATMIGCTFAFAGLGVRRRGLSLVR